MCIVIRKHLLKPRRRTTFRFGFSSILPLDSSARSCSSTTALLSVSCRRVPAWQVRHRCIFHHFNLTPTVDDPRRYNTPTLTSRDVKVAQNFCVCRAGFDGHLFVFNRHVNNLAVFINQQRDPETIFPVRNSRHRFYLQKPAAFTEQVCGRDMLISLQATASLFPTFLLHARYKLPVNTTQQLPQIPRT